MSNWVMGLSLGRGETDERRALGTRLSGPRPSGLGWHCSVLVVVVLLIVVLLVVVLLLLLLVI